MAGSDGVEGFSAGWPCDSAELARQILQVMVVADDELSVQRARVRDRCRERGRDRDRVVNVVVNVDVTATANRPTAPRA